MNTSEFSYQFDVLYNNITSKQAPDINEYEKSVFLTKAQDEIVKNYFSQRSRGNSLQEGYDDSLKRQADFMTVMKTGKCTPVTGTHINTDSKLFIYPDDLYIIVNETLDTDDKRQLQVIPLRYEDYTRLMSKPFKRPLKNQAWKLSNSVVDGKKVVEIITNADDNIDEYIVRYVRKLKPIILDNLEGLTIEGVGDVTECELDSNLHQAILQRAVELAKAAWIASNSSDNISAVSQMGQRSE